MGYIDEKFKDMPPEKTVEKIIDLLKSIGIEVTEDWHDSGIDNCWSVTIRANAGIPFFTNGKGITKAFARASAYGEFMERLQCGLFFYKYQSIMRDPKINLHTYAPDKKYMTMRELVENGEWMDYIIAEYGGTLTRESLAKQCKMYGCTDEDKILVLPFYSLFEDKYVYLPAGFVENMYSANGCCAGNSREEAWIHAMSEMMERRGSISCLIGGQAAPVIPEETLEKFPTVSKIIQKIRENGNFDVTVMDLSIGNGFPVIGTRLIDKKNHTYSVNVAADPVFEIAIQRTLTELFQGNNLRLYRSYHDSKFLEEHSSIPMTHNVLNQLETGNGLFAMDFFAEELTCEGTATDFADHSKESNKQLLTYMISLYKELGKPVYVRNYSFMGFDCYKFVVPGFSESRGERLKESVQEYALGDEAMKTLRNPAIADDAQLYMLLMFHKKILPAISRCYSFSKLAGLPLTHDCNKPLLCTTLAYAAYRLGRINEAVQYLQALVNTGSIEESTKAYFACVSRYLQLKALGANEEKIHLLLNKFYTKDDVQKLYDSLNNGTPFDAYLLKCDTTNCKACRFADRCTYSNAKELIRRAGSIYHTFEDGQRREKFKI